MEEQGFRGSVARGLLALIVLGPIAVVAATVAAASGLSAFLGIDAFGWLSKSTPLDFLYNFGVGEGSLVNYVGFMVGGVVATGAVLGIRFAFQGRS